MQSCFVHLDAVLYLLNNEFQFVGNYIGCVDALRWENNAQEEEKYGEMGI